ncbi:transposable element Tc3 transposase [Trichonephila clavipes]|nr:transposable element Tc3 transposase [Trichonephila clavipes]
MVWAAIMINGRTRLHVVANGTMTGQRYIDEVLLPHVRLFRGVVGGKFVFMDDNATCHRTLAVQDWLDSEGNQRLVWPARSPDLNPIENVWDALGRQVAGRNYPPTSKNTLIRALTEEWDKLPQLLLDNVVQMPLTNHSSAIQTHQDIPAETVSKNNSVPVTTPSCHVRSTNQDTLYQAGPITSGHIYKLDMGWRNASRSVSQRRPASRLILLKEREGRKYEKLVRNDLVSSANAFRISLKLVLGFK